MSVCANVDCLKIGEIVLLQTYPVIVILKMEFNILVPIKQMCAVVIGFLIKVIIIECILTNAYHFT